MKSRNILIACNSLDYILISKILKSDFNLVNVTVEEDILYSIRSVRYDLLVVDISYLRLETKLLETVKEKHIPLIALSSEPGDARDHKLLSSGCCACYIKPIRQEVFFPFITYWIEQFASTVKEQS